MAPTMQENAMTCYCQIIPGDVLKRFADDPELSAADRKAFADSAVLDAAFRAVRLQAQKFIATTMLGDAMPLAPPLAPAITVADCQHGQVLPGMPIANPGSSTDITAKRAFAETKAVADFFMKVFNRNSIDDAGMTLASSIHFGVNYNNAFWNGSRMTYGDGDGNIFIDFTASTDVIAHELTHGLTSRTLRLAYTNEAGGLNESMSDVFGSMFRQWRAGQTSPQGDWLIGADIMGPAARARGFKCLRDMAKPDAAHCLSPQPTHFSQFRTGMGPHESSGIPNLAFYKAARALGGNSWDVAGRIWYAALTGGASPNMKMKTFANRTRKVAAARYPAAVAAVDAGWKAVGL